METASQSMGKMAKLSTEWEPKSDVWFHTYGAYLLCGLTVASSTYIVAHFRQHLRLERYARMVMYSVGAGFPFIAAGTYNQYWSNLYIARKGERCHTCIAVKNAVFQSGMTVLYPSLLTCLMGFFYAQSYHTIPSVPANFLSSKEQAAHVWRLVQAIAERSHFSKIMMLLFLVNLFAGYYVSEKQQEECVLMFKKILDQQEMIVQANRGVAVVDSYTDSFH